MTTMHRSSLNVGDVLYFSIYMSGKSASSMFLDEVKMLGIRTKHGWKFDCV